jgi:hypothetical protein
VKTNHKNAMQQGEGCGLGRLYSCASRSGHAVQSRTH